MPVPNPGPYHVIRGRGGGGVVQVLAYGLEGGRGIFFPTAKRSAQNLLRNPGNVCSRIGRCSGQRLFTMLSVADRTFDPHTLWSDCKWPKGLM